MHGQVGPPGTPGGKLCRRGVLGCMMSPWRLLGVGREHFPRTYVRSYLLAKDKQPQHPPKEAGGCPASTC